MPTRRGLLKAGAAGASLIGIGVRLDAAATVRTAVDFDVPTGGCDCHVHVFDPGRFPYAPERVYTPPPASLEDLRSLQAALHLDRVVIVQPSVYGTDNSCTLDAVRRLAPRARGVAVIDTSTTGVALDELAAGGIRGVRLNFETVGESDPVAIRRHLKAITDRLSGRNWHVQFNTSLPVIAALQDDFAALPFPVVFDHFGRAKAALGLSQPGVDALLGLVKSGHAYVKISAAYRMSEKPPDLAAAAPIAQALVPPNADRVVWGSNWPHPGRGPTATDIAPPYPNDDGLLFNQLPKWLGDPTTVRKVLVDNPARLYGF